ncbi:MAG: FkbM family methyltransferase [Cognatishimia activa]
MASLKRWLDKRRNPWRAQHLDAYSAWKKERGSSKLYDYSELPEQAIVFDFGGFKGEWSDIVLQQIPLASIKIFEPHPGFASELKTKFQAKQNVETYAFALGSKTETLLLSDEGDASSAVAEHSKAFSASFISVSDFFLSSEIRHIDLAKINIEGGEYDLLPALMDAGLINRFDRLQVQFHLFEPKMQEQRDRIRQQLEATHKCVWCYPFVWEEWRLK